MLRAAPGPESPCNIGSKAKEDFFEVTRFCVIRSLFLASGLHVACCCVDLGKPISACRSRIDAHTQLLRGFATETKNMHALQRTHQARWSPHSTLHRSRGHSLHARAASTAVQQDTVPLPRDAASMVQQAAEAVQRWQSSNFYYSCTLCH
jgi:hypothetical protein